MHLLKVCAYYYRDLLSQYFCVPPNFDGPTVRYFLIVRSICDPSLPCQETIWDWDEPVS